MGPSYLSPRLWQVMKFVHVNVVQVVMRPVGDPTCVGDEHWNGDRLFGAFDSR